MSVDLDQCDSKGNPITGACIVSTKEEPKIDVAASSKYPELALECFHKTKSTWQQNFIQSCSDSATEESKKKRFRTTVSKLIEEGKVKELGDGVYQQAFK